MAIEVRMCVTFQPYKKCANALIFHPNYIPSFLNFCMVVKVNKCLRYVHICLELVILIPTSTKNPSQKPVVLESSVKTSLTKPLLSVWQPRLGFAEYSRTTNSGQLQVSDGNASHHFYLNAVNIV